MAAIDILPLVPDTYDATNQIMRHADIIPDFSLPSGKIFVLAKGPEWGHAQIFAKGQTALRHNDISGIDAGTLTTLKNTGKTLHSVPFTPELLGIGGGGPFGWVGTFPDMYNTMYFPGGLPDYNGGVTLGQNCLIDHKYTVAETMENNHYTNPRAAFWAGYYDAKTPRLLDRHGPGYLQSHDYLFINIGPDWHYISADQAKAYFRNLSSLPNFDFTTGTLKHCNLYVGDGYPGPMNRDNRIIYSIALKARMYHALGKKYCVYPTMEREWMPNMFNGNKVPTGTFYHQSKMPFPAPLMAKVTMAGLHFGDGLIGWNAGGKVTNKVWANTWTEQLFNGSFYVKNGETEQRNWRELPNLSGGSNYNYVKWSANEDFAAFAARNYAATMGQTAGGTTRAVNFKINNGPVITALNTFQDDLCRAKYTQGPIVETTLVDGLESLYFTDPCGTNQKKTVTVYGQTGQTYTFEACGTSDHVALMTT